MIDKLVSCVLITQTLVKIKENKAEMSGVGEQHVVIRG